MSQKTLIIRVLLVATLLFLITTSSIPQLTLSSEPVITSSLPQLQQDSLSPTSLNHPLKRSSSILMDQNLRSFIQNDSLPLPSSLILIRKTPDPLLTPLPWGPLGNYWLAGVTVHSRAQLQAILTDTQMIAMFLSSLSSSTENYWHQLTPRSPLPSYSSSSSFLPSSFRVQNITGASTVHSWNITGKNVVVGVVDSGIDFGVTGLEQAYAKDYDGLPASFDPSGAGLVLTPLSVTPVTEGSDTYLPISSDFPVWTGENYQLVNASKLGITMHNIDITNIPITSQSNTYKVGLSYFPSGSSLQANETLSFVLVFPFVLVDGHTPGVYDTVYVDLDTGLGLSLSLSGLLFEGSTTYNRLVDWSLSDETPFNNTNPVLARDVTGDGINDASAGMLAQTLDIYHVLSDGDLIRGILPNGDGLAIFYDFVGHGTSSAASIAARPNTPFQVYDNPTTPYIENNTIYTLPGSAPGASLIGAKFGGASLLDIIYDWYWVSGMTPQKTYDPITQELQYTWVYTNTHRANVTNNSFGFPSVDVFSNIKGLDLLTLFIDFLSYPKTIDPTYPGMLFVVSIGNSGPGIGTVSTPASAGSALTVGSSTEMHYLSNSYGYDQGYDQVSFFSSRGPTTQGLMKPDVVHVGQTGLINSPVIFGKGNGSLAFTEFIGTSQSGPYTSGVAALVLQALTQEGYTYDPALIKQIIMGTSVDLGYEAISQGAGRVNAENAVGYVLGKNPAFFATDGTLSYGLMIAKAFNTLFGIDPPALTSTLKFVPNFYGDLQRNKNDYASLTFRMQYINGTTIPFALTPTYYQQENSTVGSYTTNDRVNYIDISSLLNLPQIPMNTTLKIIIYMKADDYKFYDDRDIFPSFMLFEFQDQNHNNLIDANNSTLPAEIKVEQQDLFKIWTLQIDYARNHATTGQKLFLRVIDPGFSDSTPLWKGFTFAYHLDLYTRVQYSNILSTPLGQARQLTLFANNTPSNWVGLQVLAKASVNNQTFSFQLPVSANILQTIPQGPAYLDFTPVTEQYGSPKSFIGNLNHASYARGDQGDTFSYKAVIPGNLTYLAIRVEWVNPLSMIDAYVSVSTGEVIATSNIIYLGSGQYASTSSEPAAQNFLIDIKGKNYTQLIITLHVVNIAPYSPNEQITLKLRGLTYQSIPQPTVTYSSPPDSTITGDLTLTVPPFSIPEIPELSLQTHTLQVKHSVYNKTITGLITNITQATQAPLSIDALHDLILTPNVGASITLQWNDSNVDLDMYLVSQQNPDVDVFLGQGATTNTMEQVIFTPNESSYLLLIDYAKGVAPVNYTIIIQQYQLFYKDSKESSFEISINTQNFPNGSYTLTSFFTSNFAYLFHTSANFRFTSLYPTYTIQITSPKNNTAVKNSLEVTWEINPTPQTTYVSSVQLKLQGSSHEWMELGKTTSRTLTLDLTNYDSGIYLLRIVVFTPHQFTISSPVLIEIQNIPQSSITTNTPLIMPPFFLVLGILFLLKKKRKELTL